MLQGKTWRSSVHNYIMVMGVVLFAVDLISNGILGGFPVLLLYSASLTLFSFSELHSIKPSKITYDCQAALASFFYIYFYFIYDWPSLRIGNTCHSKHNVIFPRACPQ